jgi:hypothetical protein
MGGGSCNFLLMSTDLHGKEPSRSTLQRYLLKIVLQCEYAVSMASVCLRNFLDTRWTQDEISNPSSGYQEFQVVLLLGQFGILEGSERPVFVHKSE